MSASNIYLRLVTASGPVIGEGLLEGWETSIELKSFDWGMEVLKDSTGKKSIGGALASMAGLGPTIKVQMEPLKFTKRFDLSSFHIHLCLDNHIKVVTAAITVLHMKPNVIPPHAPGFVLNCANGYFESTSLKLAQDGNMSELEEEVVMNFTSIQMQYLKPIAGQPTPMAPFFHGKLV
jgi:type VI protein secretion system component Hcp